MSFLLSDGLATVGNAPKIFMKTSRGGLPYVAIGTCSLFGLLSFMGVKSGSGKVFTWFVNMTSIAGSPEFVCEPQYNLLNRQNRPPYVVWYLGYLYSLSQRIQSSGLRSVQTSLCIKVTAFCCLVCRHFLLHYLLRMFLHLINRQRLTFDYVTHSSVDGQSS